MGFCRGIKGDQRLKVTSTRTHCFKTRGYILKITVRDVAETSVFKGRAILKCVSTVYLDPKEPNVMLKFF